MDHCEGTEAGRPVRSVARVHRAGGNWVSRPRFRRQFQRTGVCKYLVRTYVRDMHPPYACIHIIQLRD